MSTTAPADHYDEAERLLEAATAAPDPLTAARLVTRAQVHATLATVDVVETVDTEGPAVEALEALREWAETTPRVLVDDSLSPLEAAAGADADARAAVLALVAPTLEALGR